MQNALTIARREFAGYFNGPVAYIVICLVLIALGVAHCALGLILVLGAGSVAGLLELQLAGANPLALLWVGLGAAVLVSAWRWHRAGDGADDGRSRPGRAVR